MMPYEKKSKAGLILGLVAATEFILLIVFAIIVSNISNNALNKMPEMTAQVEVVGKHIKGSGSISTKYYVRFRFKDGMEKDFKTDSEWYEVLQENQNGTLYYKEDLPNTLDSEYRREFVGFEKASLEQAGEPK